MNKIVISAYFIFHCLVILFLTYIVVYFFMNGYTGYGLLHSISVIINTAIVVRNFKLVLRK